MADQVYVDASVTSASVIMVGGECYHRIGGVSVPPNVSSVEGVFESCGECGTCVSAAYVGCTFSGIGLPPPTCFGYSSYSPRPTTNSGAGNINYSFTALKAGGSIAGVPFPASCAAYTQCFAPNGNSGYACQGTSSYCGCGLEPGDNNAYIGIGIAIPKTLSNGIAFAWSGVGTGVPTLTLGDFSLPANLPSSGTYSNNSQTGWSLVSDGTYSYQLLTFAGGGNLTFSENVPVIPISSLPESVTISGGPITSVAGYVPIPNPNPPYFGTGYCAGAMEQTIQIDGNYALDHTTLCDTDSSQAIGVQYGKVAVAWGYINNGGPNGATSYWSIFIPNNGRDILYTSPTLLGTYTALNQPYVTPPTLTVTA